MKSQPIHPAAITLPPTLSVEIKIAVLDCTLETTAAHGHDSPLQTPPTPRSTSSAIS
jgi:hypothetical protein